jgi:hypothetical protein
MAYFVLGSVVGTAGDKIAHEAQGVLTYRHPVVLGEAWWVPLLMGGAGIAFPISHAMFRRRAGAAPPPATLREVVATFALFFGAYVASGLFKDHPLALTLVFSAGFLVAAWRARWAGWQWLFALGCAAGGAGTEMAISATGTFWYIAPDFLGVPIWLPALYLHVARWTSALERRWPVA